MAIALYRKSRTFAAMPAAGKFMFAEAVITSAYVKFVLLFLSFSRVAGWLGTANRVAQETGNEGSGKTILQVSRAVRLGRRYVPWNCECYTSALTAKVMLKRRSVPATLYFGFRKNGEGSLEGHAWLQSCGRIVTGQGDLSRFTVHSYFS